MSTLDSELRAAVGDAHLLLDGDLCAPYQSDWTRRFTGRARAVVRPADTAQVAAVVRACARARVPMVVQGGNTGLVGGGVPDPEHPGRDVLISLARLSTVERVDVAAAQVTAGAGVTLERLQGHARAAGLDFGVDLAARSQATVGGLIATNAGGVQVPRHGSMRAQVAGLEAVLADGTVISRLGGLAKDNTGYDLAGLLCGSEGTLAIVTAARLRLVPAPAARAVALVAVPDTAGALALLAAARARLSVLSTVELFFPDGLDLVCRYGHLGAPFAASAGVPAGAYVLLECEGRGDPTDELLDLLGGCEVVLDATVAADATGRARLWAYRESHTEAIGAAGVPVKLDVCVPLPALPDLVAALPGAVARAAPSARLIVFGHLNEANLHVNVLDAGPNTEAVTEAVLVSVASLGGSISSEHGIGRAKAHWLHLSRTPAEIAAMRAVKSALDPDGLLAPGVLFPAG